MPMKGQHLLWIVPDIVVVDLLDETCGVIEAHDQIAPVVRLLVAVNAGKVAPLDCFDDVIHGV
jgi:hypothetical protein